MNATNERNEVWFCDVDIKRPIQDYTMWCNEINKSVSEYTVTNATRFSQDMSV